MTLIDTVGPVAARQQQVQVYIAQLQIQFPGSTATITGESLLAKQHSFFSEQTMITLIMILTSPRP